ncbi:MAG: ATP synthase F1 subunit delta [Candidatus Zixiibacteriota bacterium]
MLAQEVAKKYSQALFDSANGKGLVDPAYDQLASLKELVAQDKTLLNFLQAPEVSDENKKALIRDVFGPRMERLFVEFLLVLIEKRRINFLPGIIDEFRILVEQAKGIARAYVTSAVPLDDKQRSDLVAGLAVRTGLTIELEEKVDPSILGGMIVVVNNEIIDGSVRHGLSVIEERLSRVRVH